MSAAVRRAARPSGLVWNRMMTCGSPIVPNMVATSTAHVASSGCPVSPRSSSGRVQSGPPGAASPSGTGAALPSAKTTVEPAGTCQSPAGTADTAPSESTTRTPSGTSRVASTRKDTGVRVSKWVNSTGCRASFRTPGPTWVSSHTAGTMNSTSLSTNWNAWT